MSDTDRPTPTVSGPFVHYCHCGKFGGHGFFTALGAETRWWCWEHYPYKGSSDARTEATSIADMLGTKRAGSAL